jgi:hypothetical protein
VGSVEDDLLASVDEWRTFAGGERDRALAAEAQVARLTHLLGSHADGHRCTCTLTRAANYSLMTPDEWEQDPWCPTHPDVESIKHWIEGLAHNWSEEADYGEDERYGRIIARTLRLCATELRALVANGASA